MAPSARIALGLGLALLAAVPAFAQSEEEVYGQIEAIHSDAEGFMLTADEVADAMGQGDWETVAAHATFPLTAFANGETFDILEPADLRAFGEGFLPSELLAEIAAFTLADLIVTDEGVGFASGAMWMTNICLDDACSDTQWMITTLNDLNPAYQ